MQVEKLVRMANQIAANFDYGPDKQKAVAGVVDHLQRFWAPSMRNLISAHVEGGGSGLSDLAMAAVKRLDAA